MGTECGGSGGSGKVLLVLLPLIKYKRERVTAIWKSAFLWEVVVAAESLTVDIEMLFARRDPFLQF